MYYILTLPRDEATEFELPRDGATELEIFCLDNYHPSTMLRRRKNNASLRGLVRRSAFCNFVLQ